MTTLTLRVLRAGPHSTLQDGGRPGAQRLGVSPAGAADPLALGIANELLGQAPDTAGIESTLHGDAYILEPGPRGVATGTLHVAVAGDVEVTVDGATLQPWRTLTLRIGQVLDIGPVNRGARCVLAIGGRLEVPRPLGSASAHARNGLGFAGGRPLAAGDALSVEVTPPLGPDLALDRSAWPRAEGKLRLLPGPHAAHFAEGALRVLEAGPYLVGSVSDRMALRLQGPPLAHRWTADVVSTGVATGCVQVPGDGAPLLLLPDRQSTGGYAIAAVVIAADLWRLGQLRPGAPVSFAFVTPAEAASARQHRQIEAQRRKLALRPVPEVLLASNLIGGVCGAEDEG